jgi:hypothetical protein
MMGSYQSKFLGFVGYKQLADEIQGNECSTFGVEFFALAVIRRISNSVNGQPHARMVNGWRLDDSYAGKFTGATEINPPHDATPTTKAGPSSV